MVQLGWSGDGTPQLTFPLSTTLQCQTKRGGWLRTDGAEEDAGVGSREDRLKPDTVPTAFPKILSPLIGDALSHGDGADPPGLGQEDS